MPNYGKATQQALKELFSDVFKRGPKMYRADATIDFGRELKFRRKRQFEPADMADQGLADKGEPGGIYWAEHPLDIRSLISPEYLSTKTKLEHRRANKANLLEAKHPDGRAYVPYNIKAAPLPDARVKKFDTDEWVELFGEMPKNKLTRELRKDYDFVRFPDVAASQAPINQYVQLNPKKAIAQIQEARGLPPHYKILGLAGALGLGAQALPNEAEASPLGKFWKAGSKSIIKSMEKPATRSSDVLAGFEIPGKGVIKEVRGASGSPWRDVHFEDGTMQVMTKDYVAELARTAGTDKYMTRYQSAQYKKKVDQALTSLQGHRDRYSGHTPRELRDLESVKVTKGRELKVATPERIFVKDLGMGSPRDKGQVYMMLKPYAELLEKKGYVQIGDQKMLKGFYDGWEKMQMPDAFKVVKPKE